MTSREALEDIKNEVEYLTRLDYVDPIVRGEVKELLYNAYHKTTPEFEIIERDLEMLEIIKKHSFLDLSVLADYDISEFDEYFDDWHDTTNELDRKEFELLKEYLENE